MHSLLKWRSFTGCLLFILLSQGTVNANAFEIVVVDAQGNPVKNAVIELSGGLPEAKRSKEPLIIDQINKAFQPEVLIAPKNSLVNFPNSDNIRHHVYSFSPAKTFELKLYAGEPKDPVLFDQPGLVVLGCNIHDSMVGYIYVSTSPAYLTDENGIARIEQARDQVSSFTVWHPDAEKGVDFRKKIKLTSKQQNRIKVSLSISPPEPRNTFEDVFGFH